MRIFIDPGHGGNDSGAIANLDIPVYEKDLNLSAAYYLCGLLNALGHEPILTRIVDETMSLECRTGEANDYPAVGLFVSVHCNSFTSPAPRGFEVWHYPRSVEGKKLAEKLVNSVRCLSDIKIHGDGVHQRKFYVLKHTTMTAVLLELSFMSNPEDLEYLTTHQKLFKMMQLIAETITLYVLDSY